MSGRVTYVKDEIQLAHALEISIEQFHKEMNRFEIGEFIVSHVHAEREI